MRSAWGPLLAGCPAGHILDRNSDAMNLEARCRAGSPRPRGEQIAKPAEQATRSAGFFRLPPPRRGIMRYRLHVTLSRGTGISRLLALVALGVLLTTCRDAERSLAPRVDAAQFSLSAAEGLRGTIAFHSNRDGDFDIYVMNADGSGVTHLTDDPATDFGDRAGWSPDGRRFVFSSTRDGGDIDIFVMNADGTGVSQLTHNDFIADDDPVWSPDGKQIAFHSTRDGGDEDIFVMNADGTGVIQLTNNSVLPDGSPIFDAVPAWTASVAPAVRCLPPPAGLTAWW